MMAKKETIKENKTIKTNRQFGTIITILYSNNSILFIQNNWSKLFF